MNCVATPTANGYAKGLPGPQHCNATWSSAICRGSLKCGHGRWSR
jgi:hypothetical protein